MTSGCVNGCWCPGVAPVRTITKMSTNPKTDVFSNTVEPNNIGLQKTHRHTRGQGTTDGKTRSCKPKKTNETRHNNQNARTQCVNTRAKFWTPSSWKEGVQKNGVLAFRGYWWRGSVASLLLQCTGKVPTATCDMSLHGGPFLLPALLVM